MISTWHYRYAGVDVASSLELPEWATFTSASSPHEPHIVIRHTAPMASPDCTTYTLAADAAGLTFCLPKIGSYRIHGGTAINLMPCADVDIGNLRLFLLGSAWGALSYQRGWFPLHASIVQVGDGAVAFCAPAGGGKSSVAAWLVKQGYPLFSDDLCRLDVTGDQPPRVWRSAPRLKLWEDALLALDWQDAQRTRDEQSVDKFHLAYPAEHLAETLPLRALYLLEWGELRVQRLSGLRAVQAAIEAATYRPEFVKALGQTAIYWQRAIELASQLPIFRLRRPRDWAAMPVVGDQLIKHYQGVSGESHNHHST